MFLYIYTELLRYKIRNGTSQIISCDPSDHISTCIRHFSSIETLYKVFYSTIYAHYTSYFTRCAVAIELKLSRAAYSKLRCLRIYLLAITNPKHTNFSMHVA